MANTFFPKHRLAVIVLVLTCLALFANTFQNQFVRGDDTCLIRENPYIRSYKNIPLFFSFHYWNHLHPFKAQGQYRPLRTVTFALDYFFWKLNPTGYHLTNLLLHMVNVILVYYGIVFLCGQPGETRRPDIGSFPCLPFLTALFFTVHPVHTESIVFIKNRSELLACLFFLMAFISFLISNQQDRPLKRNLHFGLALISFGLAIIAKETALSLPFVLSFYALCFSSTSHCFKTIGKTGPFWILFLVFFWFRQSGLLLTGENNLSLSFWQNILVVVKTVVTYLRLLLFPLHFTVDHIFPVPVVFFSLNTILSVFAVLLLCVVIVVLYRKSRLLCFGLAWILLTLLPSSNLVFLDTRPIAEQRLYIPSVGFCLFLSAVIRGVFPGKRYVSRPFHLAIFVMMFSLIFFYCFQTVQRNRGWRNSFTFYSKAVRLSPGSSRAYLGLGNALLEKGYPEKAAQCYYTALHLKPDYAAAQTSLGVALAEQGFLDEAMGYYNAALQCNPEDGNAYCNIGNAWLEKGDTQKALENYHLALQLRPDDAEIYCNLALALMKDGRLEEALQNSRYALKLDPCFSQAYYRIGVLLALTGRSEEAAENFLVALKFKSDYAEPYRGLGIIRAKQGFLKKAIAHYHAALQLAPEDADTHFGLGETLAKQGDMKKALAHYRLALQYRPDYIDAHYNLGLALAGEGMLGKAASHFETILQLNPEDAMSWYHLGNIAMQRGMRERAVQHYQQALAIDPECAAAKKSLNQAAERKPQ